ncbi:MAG: GNAT family N-acetyltransferase [Erysipelotrichaceae bacterium]|nr:GNAT family N-acetyltransferase [Erysipelotrichaceae bacterium]MDY5252156.1 GNAT family N-acetyltransferase [Erysipelotrichaceae bacterium]
MQTIIKHFNQLTVQELHEIYHLRVSVFVVEQKCPYQEIDDIDPLCYHAYLKEDGKIVAYIRLIAPGIKFDDASIGRVISIQRRKGYGTLLMKEGIKFIKDNFATSSITIEAQQYAINFYQQVGFETISKPFLEDDIPHVKMRLIFK